jgi:predicted dehydrogenase
MKNLSRRKFLQSAAVAGTGAIFIPNLISCAPSTRLKYAVIGVGGRGQASWDKVAPEDIVAICDVDDVRAAKGYKALPHAKRYKDFRKMFDEMANEFDAVMIATPDHTHFAAAMEAMQRGKHVLVEKPLAHNVWQLRTLKKAAKHYGVVSQLANQGHTTNGIRLIKEWYDAGILGEVKEVQAWIPGFKNNQTHYPPLKQPVPAGLDWDLWVGPQKFRDYNRSYCPFTWRMHYDFGSGQIADWACHTLDAPFWALDLGMPHTVEGIVENITPDHSYIAEKSVLKYQFGARGNKPPVKMTWSESTPPDVDLSVMGLKEMPGQGMVMVGEKMSLITGGRPNNPKLVMSPEQWEDFKKNAPEKTIPRVGEERPVEEWIDAIKGGYQPGSNFEYGASLTEVALIGSMAQRFGTKLEYDAKNMKVTNHPELDAYIKEPVREGWAYGEDLW